MSKTLAVLIWRCSRGVRSVLPQRHPSALSGTGLSRWCQPSLAHLAIAQVSQGGGCTYGDYSGLTDQWDPETCCTSGDIVLCPMDYVHNAYCELDVLKSNRCHTKFPKMSYVTRPPPASIKEQNNTISNSLLFFNKEATSILHTWWDDDEHTYKLFCRFIFTLESYE